MHRSTKISRLIKAVVFTLLFLVLLTFVSYTLRPYSGSTSRKNLCGFYAEPDNTLDAVFIGSSSVFAFWDAMDFWKDTGAATYNFATGTMPAQYLRSCIQEIRKTQDPSLYVIDLRPFTIAESGYYKQREVANMDHDVPLRNVLDNMKYSWNRVKMIQEGVPDTYDKLPYYFDLMKYHTEWNRLIDRQSLLFSRNEAHDATKGFRLVPDVKAQDDTDYSAIAERKPLSDRLDPILTDLLDYCDQENLTVLFLVNTYTETKNEKMIYNYIGDVVAKRGYLFLNTNDFREASDIDYATDFYDHWHVNIFGAEKYTAFVGAYIQEHYHLPDHRGEDAYVQWDRDYETWSSLVADTKETILKKMENL